MKYNNRNYLVPSSQRPQVNENILMLIDSNDLQEVTHEEIYNILLASRPFTAEEVTQNEKSYRLRFVYYKDWEALIVDEYRVTEDADWIEKLITISRSKLTVPQVIIKAIMNRS